MCGLEGNISGHIKTVSSDPSFERGREGLREVTDVSRPHTVVVEQRPNSRCPNYCPSVL